MLRPVIFIGCGGSGEKAVRYVRAAVKRTLDQSDWEHGMPDSWQFIGLDTLTTQENPTEIPTIPVNDFLTLSAEHDSYAALYRSLEAGHSGHRGQPELLCGWLPESGEVQVPIKDGAGQNRAIGRAVGLRSLERTLAPRLSEAFRRAKSGNADLYEVGKCLGVDAELGSETPEPLVVVCSSMAGGTGAGVSLDVVELLRRSDPLGNYPTLVLFSNDIFNLAEHNQAMAANSLGLVSELLAAYWSEPGEIASPLSDGNVQNPGVGPHSIFVLGKSGYSGADLGDTADFYHAVGDALASWVVSSTVQEQIHNFVNVNWRNAAKENYGGYPFGKAEQFGAVSSFGAAKVTVGRELFDKWSRDLLGKQILESLQTGHLRFKKDGSNLTDQELIEELGKQRAEMIYQAWPRWERQPEHVPGCKGASEHFAPDSQLKAQASELYRKIKDKLPSGQQEATAEQWHSQVQKTARQVVADIERNTRSLSQSDHDWCANMAKATCKAASQVAAESSLSVAVAALNEAAEKFNREEISKVRREVAKAEQQYQKRTEEGFVQVRIAGNKISSEDPKLDEAVRRIAQGLAFLWKHHRLTRAAEVLEHAEVEVFATIADALKAAKGQADYALASDDVKNWPDNEDVVPPRYQASTVEFPLEDHTTWRGSLEELCKEAADHKVNYGQGIADSLRYRLVAGTELMTENEESKSIHPLVHQLEDKRWTPGQPVNVICKADAADIAARVDSWITNPDGKFKRFLNEGLRDYLSETDPYTDKRRIDHAERLQTFRRQLGSAKNRAEPLVSIDNDLYGQCHEKRLDFTTVCSQFPFSDSHPAAEDARKIIGSDAYKPSDSDMSWVLISQYLSRPAHPLVIRSITEPVSDALATTEDPGERSSAFWMWRRARRLDGFVPLPRQVLEWVIQGFAVARLCGYITVDLNRPMRITTEQGEAKFPWPMLSRLGDQNDVLAGLLESFSLTFGMVGSSGFGAYEGFKRLYELGEPAVEGKLHDELQELLETGKLRYPTIGSEQPKASGANPAERRYNASAYLEANKGWFSDQKNKLAEGKMWCKSADGRAEAGVPTMEFADLFDKCFSDLHTLLTETDGSRGSVV